MLLRLDFEILILLLPALVFSLCIHEFSHGYIAYILGDNTAARNGRLTLNPMAHLDPIGSLMILFVGFGWAKPVPINFQALRSPKSDMIWVALAGPSANLIMAIGWLLIFFLATNMNILILQRMADAGILINILLAIFNLLPIPPLDGSRVISALLPNPLAYKYNQLEQYGFVILIGLMWFGGFSYIVLPIVRLVLSWFRYFQALI